MIGTNADVLFPPTAHRLIRSAAIPLILPSSSRPFHQEKYPELNWRKNLNFGGWNGGCIFGNPGVDLNRNFNFMWGDPVGACSYPCSYYYHGPSAES
jgi:hypothetical protein